jgi:hypothetical protein
VAVGVAVRVGLGGRGVEVVVAVAVAGGRVDVAVAGSVGVSGGSVGVVVAAGASVAVGSAAIAAAGVLVHPRLGGKGGSASERCPEQAIVAIAKVRMKVREKARTQRAGSAMPLL